MCAKLYKDNDDKTEKIEKARNEVEEVAKGRLQRGLHDTIQQARAWTYRHRPDLTRVLDGAPLPQQEPTEPVTKSDGEKAADTLLEKAAVLRDKLPGLSRADAILEAARRHPELTERWVNGGH